MQLKLLMTLRADLRKPSDDIGSASLGHRMVAEVIEGSFEGDRLNGSVITPGADWVLLGNDGVGQVDVRITLKTDDDALIYVQYLGKLHFNEKVAAALANDGETEFGDTYFMTQPRFETGADNYSWLNGIVAVAEGRLTSTGVEYQVYECVPG
ncbi:MAG: DUF3237 domain-containing protein [Gammaproteobacteria bacterium]|nr:DUF3237 domain-containing protein [Gammaproteobacteria bacterium]